MKTPNDLFGRLPSVNDLLENPRIKSLVDRVQEMEVASGLRQYVDRLRDEVSRRALDAPIPSIGELADRAARFILGRHASDQPQAINATGQFWPPNLSGPPLADEALASMTAAAQHYRVMGDGAATRLAAELTGGQSARLFSNSAAAMLVALESLSDGKCIVVSRAELGTMDGTRLTDLAEQAGAELIEVGAADSVTVDDYACGLEQGGGVVLRIESMPHALRGQTCRPELAELAKLAEASNAKVIHNIGRGPLTPLGEAIPLEVVSASESLSAGATIVVARGDGYTGGPGCGIAIGRREAMARIDAAPLAAVLRADSLVERALAATLMLHREPDRAALAIPALSLLSTPLLNLESRAERLAAQIATQPGILSAAAMQIPAGDDLGGMRPLASFGMSVVCESEELQRIQSQLNDAVPRVVGLWDGDRVVLDLRTVLPSDDIALAAAFESPAATGEPQESGS